MSHPNDTILDEMHDLVIRKKAIDARLEALSQDLICEVCEGRDDVAIRLIATDRPICRHCFDAWYDGAGSHDAIRAASLEQQGRT